MTKEILLVAEAVSNEKGVSEDIIFEAIELALATATKKRYDEEADIQVTIDRKTGDYVTVRRWLVVPDHEMALLGTQFTTEEAAERNPSLRPGDVHEETVENVGFGRIAAQTAKQVIVQRVRDAERAQVVEQYTGRVGELVAGTVAAGPAMEAPQRQFILVFDDYGEQQLLGYEQVLAEIRLFALWPDQPKTHLPPVTIILLGINYGRLRLEAGAGFHLHRWRTCGKQYTGQDQAGSN